MALLLNIDTALDHAYLCLAEDDEVVRGIENDSLKDHASWIQRAISQLLQETGFKMEDIAAVGISNGPGSYTGLRIGLSTAKGLCYALKIPLITVGTLEILALTAIKGIEDSNVHFTSIDDETSEIAKLLFCPMIDARRMEVFTAVYDLRLTEVVKPHACILTPATFEELLKRQKILFLGNGSKKFQQVCQHPDNAIFKNFPLNPSAIAAITYKNFIGNNFAGLAYTEPLYLKEFFTMKTTGLRKT